MTNPHPASGEEPATPQVDPEDRYLTTDEAAELIRVSPWTLIAWRRRGFGPPALRPTPSMVRYRLSDVHAFMRRGAGDDDAVRG